jgi:hypothetical protein
MKHINASCEQHSELLIFKEGGTYSYHWTCQVLKKFPTFYGTETFINQLQASILYTPVTTVL